MQDKSRQTMLNKVPLVTLYFWVMKILATTVGETGADYLNMGLGWGLNATTAAMTAVLLIVLSLQMNSSRYIAWRYWLTVVFISIVGTLITDAMTDELGVSLYVSTIGFAVALAGVFGWWYRSERTLSIHDIDTVSREAFYWLAILLTFALGTAAGDLVSEQAGLGYLTAGAIFGGAILIIAMGYFRGALGPILAFWLAYILTRPLGASLGDLITQPVVRGGWGLSTMPVSALFLLIILALVTYLTVSKVDSLEDRSGRR